LSSPTEISPFSNLAKVKPNQLARRFTFCIINTEIQLIELNDEEANRHLYEKRRDLSISHEKMAMYQLDPATEMHMSHMKIKASS